MHEACLIFNLLVLFISFGYAQSTYTNPVYKADFADPTVIRGPDGWFYAYATNTSVGNEFYKFKSLNHPTLFIGKSWEMPCLQNQRGLIKIFGLHMFLFDARRQRILPVLFWRITGQSSR